LDGDSNGDGVAVGDGGRVTAGDGVPLALSEPLPLGIGAGDENVVVADGSFEWDDLGAWPALARHVKQDAEGNAAVGQLVHVDSARNVVYDARTRNRAPITLVGVKDSIIVLADDSTLIASKGEAQKIKELVKKLAADSKLKRLV
jgi:mannose-1-phosphate guanylyltransferase